MATPSRTKRSRAPRRRRRYISPLWRLAAGVFGCAVGLFLYIRWLSVPWSVGNQVSQDVRELQIQWRLQRSENARIRQRLAYLHSPAGIESLARSRGYHLPGEQVYLEPASKNALPSESRLTNAKVGE